MRYYLTWEYNTAGGVCMGFVDGHGSCEFHSKSDEKAIVIAENKIKEVKNDIRTDGKKLQIFNYTLNRLISIP